MANTRVRRQLLAGLLAAALVLLAGCTQEEEVPQPTASAAPAPTQTPAAAVQFALPCYPKDSFHPISGANRTNRTLAGLVYEGLYELDQSFTPQGVLAVSSTTSADGLTWTFTLRQGVTFSDGSALTADDVAAALNLARQSALYAARLAGIASVTAGEGTVVIRLSAANGALPALLDVPICKGEGVRPLGTGPYAFSGEGESLSLVARTDWWRGESLPVQTIPLRAIQETDELIYAFDTKEIALVSTDLTGANALGYSGSYETVDYDTTSLLYVGFNARTGLCRDAALRRALSYGMDRSTVASALLSSHAVASALPFHPASDLWDSELAASLAYAPQTMLELLTEAGWSRSGDTLYRGRQSLALTLVVNQDNTYKTAVADYLAASLRQSGIQITVEKLSWEAYTAALAGGDFDLYLGETRLTADFDLSALIASGGALNYGGYANTETASLLSAFRAASGDARVTAARALAQNLAQQMPFTPLCFKCWSVLCQWGQVSGVQPTQSNVFSQFWTWTVS